MDVDAVLARHPEVALVDELAHSNVPGSRHEKRWEDIQELVDAGITVISWSGGLIDQGAWVNVALR